MPHDQLIERRDGSARRRDNGAEPHVWAAGKCVVTTTLSVESPTSAWNHRAQAGPCDGRERDRRPRPIRGEPGPRSSRSSTRRRTHGTARARSQGGGAHPGHDPVGPGRPQGVLPRCQGHHDSLTGDGETGQLLGAQLVGARGTETAKRVDTFAVALFHQMTVEGTAELDLSYTPPLGSPWDAVQIAAQAWVQNQVT